MKCEISGRPEELDSLGVDDSLRRESSEWKIKVPYVVSRARNQN